MRTVEHLTIPATKRIACLGTFCNQCKRRTSGKKGELNCGETGQGLDSCPAPDKHVFRAQVKDPYQVGDKRRSKAFETRDVDEAVKQTLAFVKAVKAGEFNDDQNQEGATTPLPTVYAPKPSSVVRYDDYPTLIQVAAKYFSYLRDDGIEPQYRKNLSEDHIKDIERFFRGFIEALKLNNIDHTVLKVNQVDSHLVGLLYTYIIEVRKLGASSYNRWMTYGKSMFNYFINSLGIEVENPFEGIKKRAIKKKRIRKLKEAQFNTFIDSIAPENGIKTYHYKGKTENKNMYRPWLSSAFKLMLQTGLRREEAFVLRFDRIVYDDDGTPLFFVQGNRKVNRIMNNEEDLQEKIAPITPALHKLLLEEFDFENLAGKPLYVIGPYEKSARKTLWNKASKSFSHYWQQLDFDPNISLKVLRKTYLTAVAVKLGDRANLISDHSDIELLKKHYVEEEAIQSMVKDFSVF